MVERDADVVEARLVAGESACPACGGELRPWAHARRRKVRDRGAVLRLRLRRSLCRGCGVTHVLLPTLLLLRRADAAAAIGEALWARHVKGWTVPAVTAAAGAPAGTVRRWLRRFSQQAEQIRAWFAASAHAWDPGLGPIVATGTAAGDALEAIGVAAAAATRRWGRSPLWAFAAGASGGRLLSNTKWSLPLPG